MRDAAWLSVRRGAAPLIVSLPHTGTDIPADIEPALASSWLARKDADWWVDRLYDFAADLGATMVRTAVSRTVIDVNRDPSGASLYPGAATTELCPTTTFDGEALYVVQPPDESEIGHRRQSYFDPYHNALTGEIERLGRRFGRVVLYEAHSIRSVIPRLFEGELPHFNIGVNGGLSCDTRLTAAVDGVVARTSFSRVVDGRFKGGWTTRSYGRPGEGVHAIQVELAMRSYLDEPTGAVSDANWPAPYDPTRAAPLRAILEDILAACLAFARSAPT